MKKECEIIKDLLPLYIDKLTSKASNEFIEKHLKDCKFCKEEYNILNSNIDCEINIPEENNYLKKFNKIKTKYFINSLIIAIWVVSILFLIISGNYKNIPAINFETIKIINKTKKFETELNNYNYEKLDNLLHIVEMSNGEIIVYSKEDFFNNLKKLNNLGVIFTKMKLLNVEWNWGDSYWKGNSSLTYQLFYKYKDKESSISLTLGLTENDKLIFWADTIQKSNINNLELKIVNYFNRSNQC